MAVRRAVELVVWWCAAVGVWMLSLSAYSSQDLMVAVVCGLPCAVTAVLARRVVGAAWRPPMASVRWAMTLPWSFVVDAVQVLTLPWRPAARRAAGEFREVPVGATGGAAPAAGRRALASVFVSSTPGAYVVDVDPEAGRALIHAVTRRSSIERQVSR
jgi:multisubunit Na+/H+ antiporter MnhE subunit